VKLLAVVDQLKGLVAGVEGVKEAHIGINQSWPTTPAAEIIPAGFDLQTLAAGGRAQLADGEVFVAVYVAMTPNLERDERELLPIVERIVAALRDPGFDSTLGGLVEDVRPVKVEFDLVKRNDRLYRSALIQVAVGDLTQPL